LDLSQATQLLTWLDEEHRKDKALLMALRSQTEVQEAQLTEQARQLQEIQASLARIESVLPRFQQLDTTIQGIRTEFANLVAKQTAEQEGLEEKRTQVERQESEAIARIIRQVQERVEALGSYENTITVLRDEDSKLRSKLTEAFEQLSELSKRVAAQPPRLDLLESGSQVMRDALAQNRLALENLNNDQLQLKAALDTLGPRLDGKTEQMQLALQELSQRRRMELDELRGKQQDQARLVEELSKEVKATQAPLARWADQMEEFAEQFERNRKTMYDLRELEKQVRQQGNEMAELQRIAAERQRAELREWQDNQIRVDEEQAIHLQQLEAWQQKAIETLKSLEERLEQNQQDVQARSDELWQAWAAFSQGQIGLVESFVKQRGKR
jgi:chromosome segregation ATPase